MPVRNLVKNKFINGDVLMMYYRQRQTEEQRQSYLNDRRYRHLDHRMMPYSESLKQH